MVSVEYHGTTQKGKRRAGDRQIEGVDFATLKFESFDSKELKMR